jgi:hypothetical protein
VTKSQSVAFLTTLVDPGQLKLSTSISIYLCFTYVTLKTEKIEESIRVVHDKNGIRMLAKVNLFILSHAKTLFTQSFLGMMGMRSHLHEQTFTNRA